MKTPKPLLTLRMVFPLAASLIALLLGEWIARGSLSADVFAEFIFPHIGAYLLAWLLLFLVWLLLDWVFRCPPLSTLGMAVLGGAPCAVNFYTLQLRGEPFLPWDLAQVSEAAGVASAAGLKIQTSMVVTIIVVLALTVGSFFLFRGRHKQRWLPRLAGSAATAAALCLLVNYTGYLFQLVHKVFLIVKTSCGIAYNNVSLSCLSRHQCVKYHGSRV